MSVSEQCAWCGGSGIVIDGGVYACPCPLGDVNRNTPVFFPSDKKKERPMHFTTWRAVPRIEAGRDFKALQSGERGDGDAD